AFPDFLGDDLVEDLFAKLHQLGGRATFDEGERFAPAGGDVVAVLFAEDLKLGLRVDKSEYVAIREILAGGQAAAEVNQRRALHQRVVDIEERRRGQVDGRLLGTRLLFCLDILKRPLGAGVGGRRFELLLSGVGFCVWAGSDTARAAGSGHRFTLSARAAFGWSTEAVWRGRSIWGFPAAFRVCE